MAEGVAVELALVGMDDDARRYFALVRDLAVRGHDDGESYVYSDPDGSNAFAKYMAMRIAALADWVLGAKQRSIYLGAMRGYLEHVIAMMAGLGRERAIEHEAFGRYSLHLAQLEDWAQIVAPPYVSSKTGRSPWRDITVVLRALAESKSVVGTTVRAKPLSTLDKLFRRLVDTERFGEPYDPRLTANDVVTLAEVRARECGEADPWRVIRSIRWPDSL